MGIRDMFGGGGTQRRSARSQMASLRAEVDDAKVLLARVLIGQMRAGGVQPRLADAEFKVFSQFGDDGIIQYLIHHLRPQSQRFVEFGVEDYSESNTRFLLVNDNWQGLVMDASSEYVASIRAQPYSWRHDLTAVAAFIDRDNVNQLIAEAGFAGPLGLLSIDIDGNDYWVWERLEVVDPLLVVAEYNGVFGGDRAVSIPYDPAFVRSEAHTSNLYWGCSLGALCHLAERKGYVFLGCNSAGNNAYFVRRNAIGPLQDVSGSAAFVEPRFRESRDAQGNLSFLSGADRLAAIAEMPLVDVATSQTLVCGELAG